MLSIYELKPRFQQLLFPVVRLLARAGITANMVTLFAVVLSILYGAAMLAWPQEKLLFLMLPGFMFLRMALNAIDGMLARSFNQQSALGMMLNEAGDVVSDAAMFAPFAFVAGAAWPLVALAMLLAALNEFVGVLGQVIAGSRRYDGPMGKSDRAFVLGALGLLIGMRMPVEAYINGIFSAICVLLVLSTWNRARRALELTRA